MSVISSRPSSYRQVSSSKERHTTSRNNLLHKITLKSFISWKILQFYSLRMNKLQQEQSKVGLSVSFLLISRLLLLFYPGFVNLLYQSYCLLCSEHSFHIFFLFQRSTQVSKKHTSSFLFYLYYCIANR